jgi:4-amino-4-deoxy-L-arabinose transferase-like glycosyltransferase
MKLDNAKGSILFLLLVAVWLLPGLIGRDPWKADEAYTFGLVKHMIESGDTVVPTLGGEPFMQKPPIFFILAAASAKMLPFLDLRTSAHGANIVFMTLTLLFLGLAGREALGREKAWYVPLIFMGTVGQFHIFHMLITDVSLVCGFAITLYGLLLSLRKPWLAGVVIGTGIGVTFMSKGLIGPGLIGVTMALLPLCFGSWRSKPYFHSWLTTSVSVLPWLLIWPIVLYRRSPQLFGEWFLENNLGRFLGHNLVNQIGQWLNVPFIEAKNTIGMPDERYNAFVDLPWFVWPAFPLACWFLWKQRRVALAKPGIQLGLLHLLVMLIIISISRNGRSLYALPELVPAALLGAYGIEFLGTRFAKGLQRFVGVAFSVIFAMGWLGWMVQFFGPPAFMWSNVIAKYPNYVPVFEWLPFLVALGFTVGWFAWLIRGKGDSKERLVTDWTLGLSGIYLFVMTLWLPMVENGMSYRHLTSIRKALPENHPIVGSKNLGEPQRAMFDFYADLTTQRIEVNPDAQNAKYFLTEREVFTKKKPEPPGGPWDLIWEDIHGQKEVYRLYQKKDAK